MIMASFFNHLFDLKNTQKLRHSFVSYKLTYILMFIMLLTRRTEFYYLTVPIGAVVGLISGLVDENHKVSYLTRVANVMAHYMLPPLELTSIIYLLMKIL